MKKKLIHRIGAFVCALVMAVSVFGASMPYYASSSGAEYVRSLLISLGYNCPELPSNYDYMLLQEGDKVWLRGIKTPHDLIGFIRLKEDISSDKSVGVCTRGWFEEGYDPDTYYEYLGLGNNFDMVKYYGPYSGGTAQDMYFSSIDNLVVLYSDFDIYWCSRLNPDRSGIWYEASIKEPIYNSNLGYLQNITSKTLFLTNSFGVSDMDSAKKSIGFSNLTTSGLDLLSGNYSIRLYSQICYYKGHTSEVYDDFFPLIFIDDFVVDDTLSISYNMKEVVDMVNSQTDNHIDWRDILFNSAVRSDNVYLQIVNNDTNEVGGYVKVAFYNNGEYEATFVTTVDEDLNADEGGYIEQEIDNEVGGGTTYEEAENDVKVVGVNAIRGLEEFSSMLEVYSSQIRSVALGIGSFLSALPIWFSGLLAVSFAFSILLFVVLMLRG